jgi:RNA polymerase sigma-70 factor (ECF subfamily)
MSRRVYGLSQTETAAALAISEGIVEKEVMRGMGLISEMIARVGVHDVPRAKVKPPAGKRHVND